MGYYISAERKRLLVHVGKTFPTFITARDGVDTHEALRSLSLERFSCAKRTAKADRHLAGMF